MAKKIEYRVREIPRYIVTRWEEEFSDDGERSACGSSCHGEFDNYEIAYQVAYALCSKEHSDLGWPLADKRIQYPRRKDDENCTPEE